MESYGEVKVWLHHTLLQNSVPLCIGFSYISPAYMQLSSALRRRIHTKTQRAQWAPSSGEIARITHWLVGSVDITGDLDSLQ
jgi:hypothetical protein